MDVNGEGAHPVFKFLKAETPSNMGQTEDLKWNFNKFVVSYFVARRFCKVICESMAGWRGIKRPKPANHRRQRVEQPCVLLRRGCGIYLQL